jgi:hypothetical protein
MIQQHKKINKTRILFMQKHLFFIHYSTTDFMGIILMCIYIGIMFACGEILREDYHALPLEFLLPIKCLGQSLDC